MPDVKWIKLATGMCADSKIRHIRRQKNGDSMALLWVLMLCMAGDKNDGGMLYLCPGVPFTDDELADELSFSPKIVKAAMALFERLGMVQRFGDGTLYITNWEKHQNVDGLDKIRQQNRERVQKHRNKKRESNAHEPLQNAHAVTLHTVTETHDVTACNAIDKEEELEEEKEGDKEIVVVAVTPGLVGVTGNDGGDDERPDFDTVEVYAANNLQVLSPGNMQELVTYKADFPDDVIKYAVDCATGRGIRNWTYVRSILRIWLDKGIKTLGDAKAEAENHAGNGKTAAQSAGKSKFNYQQHEYSNDELNNIGFNFEKYDELIASGLDKDEAYLIANGCKR